MNISSSGIRRFALLIMVIVLGVLAFFVINPILMSVIGGLLLAYIFYPVFSRIQKKVKSNSLAASITLGIGILIILVPLWFIVPILFNQLFQLYIASQNIDVSHAISSLLPTASSAFVSQATITINAAISKITSSVLSSLALDYSNLSFIFLILVKIAIVAIVFFFALKDNESFRNFASAISPLSKSHEKIMVKQFKDITTSILYGQVVVGVFQGLLAGLGLIVFGVPNAFAITVLAIILAILPFIGTPLIWIPVTIYLFIQGHTTSAIIYLLYNLLIVSTIDNVLRAYIVAKKSNISQVVILIGMIGGPLILGLLGFILGPLILAYFVTFLGIYTKKKTNKNTKKIR